MNAFFTKILGSGLMLMAGFVAAAYVKRIYSARTAALRDYQKLLELLMNKIKSSDKVLTDCLIECANEYTCQASELFVEAAKNLAVNGKTPDEAWKEAVDKTCTQLKSKDIQTLKELGMLLGATDRDGQVRLISELIDNLSKLELESDELAKKDGSLYSKLCIAGVVCIIIVFL
ncbi:MAG: stage III sporulation protein AB [Clostridiales bacterium]|jgi:stage III sporulation protein AB|nr:stage III sporulation protein AB [Clostridiales bacterium]